jgi:RHS repeat-associated protein
MFTAFYDPENRLATSTKNGISTNYVYDADGNRIKKSTGSSGTLYWYMLPGIVAESDLNGALQSEYVFFDGERVARKDFPSGTVSYYFSDQLKTAEIITDAQGNIKADSDYYPWGGELQFIANDSNHYKFTGKERDNNETGLDYFGARYYSNGLGRWVSADWSDVPVPVPYADFHDPQSLNQYSYVAGNPATKTDPNGHFQLPLVFTPPIVHYEAKDFGHALANLVVHTLNFGAEAAPGGQILKGLGVLPQLKTPYPNAGPKAQALEFTMGLALNTAIPGGGGAARELGVEAGATRAVLENATFAQRTFSEAFSANGAFSGETVTSISNALKSGGLTPADVPIQYIVRDGNTLILNTRSAQALEQAGIPRAQWNAVNMTGDAAAEARLTQQLSRNNLTSAGTPTVEPTTPPVKPKGQ